MEDFRCILCNVAVSSAETLESHYNGKQHRRMEAKARLELQGTDCKPYIRKDCFQVKSKCITDH